MSAKISRAFYQRDAKIGNSFSREIVGRWTETASENKNLGSRTGSYDMLQPLGLSPTTV